MCALRPPVPATLKAKALQLLAMRDYSRAEMEGKLQQWLRTRTAKDADPAAARNADAMHAAETGAISPPGITEYSAALMEQQQGQIDTVLDELQAKGLLSDQRAANAKASINPWRRIFYKTSLSAKPSVRTRYGKKNSAHARLRRPSVPARCAFWQDAVFPLMLFTASCGKGMNMLVDSNFFWRCINHPRFFRPLSCHFIA